MALELPALPYAYDALAPHMSKETLEYHHDKHHQAYVTNGNNLLKDSPLASKSVEEICKAAYAEKNAGLINNVGQHYNHVHFWQWMKKGGGGKSLPARLQKAVDSDLGGYDKMRTDFINAGVTQFGSGWAWIAVKNGKLECGSTATTSTTATCGRNIWKPSSTTSSTGNMSRRCSQRSRRFREQRACPSTRSPC
jgi:superoxide dismutase, Fe-Mn family